MKRLLPKMAKPRKKKKELKLTVKFVFEAFGDDDTDTKVDLKTFRNWMRDEFPKWSDTILQHFLYQNKLSQTADNPKYLLAVNVDKIIKDESSVKDEREYFDNELENLNTDIEKMIREKEEELFGKAVFNIDKKPQEKIIKYDNITTKSIRKD